MCKGCQKAVTFRFKVSTSMQYTIYKHGNYRTVERTDYEEHEATSRIMEIIHYLYCSSSYKTLLKI